jgi:hypothetical protein
MGSISSSLSPGVSDLLQTLTNLNSPVMSSKAAVSALEKAPTSDIVQLSEAVTQLESVDAMFGISTSSSSSSNSSSNILASLEAGLTGTAGSTQSTGSVLSSAALANASPTDQAANYESAIQSQVTQGLFGTTATNALSGSLFNMIG